MRIDWVDHGLQNWARWKITGGSGGRGRNVLSASSVFDMRVRTFSGYRETPIPITDYEATVMDRALSALQASHPRLQRTVLLVYLGDPQRGPLTRREIAEVEEISERTVHSRLEEADRAIASWYRARAEGRQAPKVF
jgi:DNA-directed RNA polymerase specialized sigma24 family protein